MGVECKKKQSLTVVAFDYEIQVLCVRTVSLFPPNLSKLSTELFKVDAVGRVKSYYILLIGRLRKSEKQDREMGVEYKKQKQHTKFDSGSL